MYRDKYTCQKCGIKHTLNVHHLDGWAFYPKKRYWVSNGTTLCARCHYLFHEVFQSSSRVKSTKAGYLTFISTFNVLEDHPINLLTFSRYIGS